VNLLAAKAILAVTGKSRFNASPRCRSLALQLRVLLLLGSMSDEEPVLLRVYHGFLERVPFEQHRFHSTCCYLLLDVARRRLFTWLGVKASMRDRGQVDKCKSMLLEVRLLFCFLTLQNPAMREIGSLLSPVSFLHCCLQHDLPADWISMPVIRASMVNRNSDEILSFREVLRSTAADADAPVDESQPVVVPQSLYLLSVFNSVELDYSGSDRLQLLAEATPETPALLPHGLLVGRPGAAFLLRTMHESFLYFTRDCSEQTQERAHAAFTSANSATANNFLTVAHEGEEPSVFKHRFSGWPGFPPPPPAPEAVAPAAPAAAAADGSNSDSSAAGAARHRSSRSTERSGSLAAQGAAPAAAPAPLERVRSYRRRPRAAVGGGAGLGVSRGYTLAQQKSSSSSSSSRRDSSDTAAAAAAGSSSSSTRQTASSASPAVNRRSRSRSASSGNGAAAAATHAAQQQQHSENKNTSWRPQRQGTGRVKAAEDWFSELSGGGSGGSDGGAEAEPLITVSLRGIQAEVQRSMLSADTGTPALMEAGCGDPSDLSLEMHRAMGGKGLVRQWQVSHHYY
jgi:hypothetical protein